MLYEEWPYHPDRLPADKHEREKALEQLQDQFYAEISSDPRAEEFLKAFHPSSAAPFFRHYAFRKRMLVSLSAFKMQEAETRELRYRDETEDALRAILQKKLFNTELLWRAEQLDIPGIRCSMDFYRWEREPKGCPFIDPVSEEEIEAMQDFLLSEDCSLQRGAYGISLHSLLDIRRDEDEESGWQGMPEWFEYYDSRFGTGHLLLLPDLRGGKEDYYRDLYFAEQREQRETSGDISAPREQRPFMQFYDLQYHYALAEQVEDDIFRHLFYHEWQQEADRLKAEKASGVYEIDEIILKLENVPDPPPVRGGVSWREALVLCWQDYMKRTISEDLPLVWEEYKFYRETGLDLASEPEDEQGLGDMVAEQILRGRELAGEPRNFDF